MASLTLTADQIRRIKERHGKLKDVRTAFDGQYRDLQKYFAPHRGRFVTSDRNRGGKKITGIVNGTSLIAARTLAAGMMSGLTSPTRPWFALNVADPLISEARGTRIWLDSVNQLMLDVFQRSALYDALATVYLELGIFGVAAMSTVGSSETGLSARALTVGEYSIASDDRGKVNTFFREFEASVGQLVQWFGKDNCSAKTQSAYDRGDYDSGIVVIHAVQPNAFFDPTSLVGAFKRFSSVYLEIGGDEGKTLGVSGFDEFPVMVPRWEVTSTDDYGGNSPAMVALGDTQALQTLEKKKAQAIEKVNNPPMVADTSLRNEPATVLPGGITYVQNSTGKGFSPAYQINPPIDYMSAEVERHQDRINRAMFSDLFLMLQALDDRQRTAREISERHEEKLLMLGPVLERLHEELLKPLVDRAFSIMSRNGWLPPAPPELQGQELKVEFISVLAQAQKAVSNGANQQFLGFVQAVAQLNPQALDIVDFHELLIGVADASGVKPSVIRDKKTVEETQRKAQETQAAIAAQQIQGQAGMQQAQTMKTMGDTNMANAQQIAGAA